MNFATGKSYLRTTLFSNLIYVGTVTRARLSQVSTRPVGNAVGFFLCFTQYPLCYDK